MVFHSHVRSPFSACRPHMAGDEVITPACWAAQRSSASDRFQVCPPKKTGRESTNAGSSPKKRGGGSRKKWWSRLPKKVGKKSKTSIIHEPKSHQAIASGYDIHS